MSWVSRSALLLYHRLYALFDPVLQSIQNYGAFRLVEATQNRLRKGI